MVCYSLMIYEINRNKPVLTVCGVKFQGKIYIMITRPPSRHMAPNRTPNPRMRVGHRGGHPDTTDVRAASRPPPRRPSPPPEGPDKAPAANGLATSSRDTEPAGVPCEGARSGVTLRGRAVRKEAAGTHRSAASTLWDGGRPSVPCTPQKEAPGGPVTPHAQKGGGSPA